MKDPKSLIEYPNKIQDIYKNIEEYILSRKCNVLIVFGDMIADMTSNKKLNQTATEVFIRRRKQQVSPVFITQFYFVAPKDVRLNFALFYYESYKQTRNSANLF